MKTKKLLLNLGAVVGFVLLILPMFLAMYQNLVGAGSLTSTEPIGIFADWSILAELYSAAGKTFPSFLSIIIDILAVVLLWLASVYVLLFVLQLLKVGKTAKLDKMKRLFSLITLIVTILVAVLYVIFVLTASVKEGSLAYAFIPGIGTYMLFAGGLMLGVFGILASTKK